MDKEDVVHINTYTQWIIIQPLKKGEKNENLPLATTWMDLENITLREVKSDRERQIPHVFTYL